VEKWKDGIMENWEERKNRIIEKWNNEQRNDRMLDSPVFQYSNIPVFQHSSITTDYFKELLLFTSNLID